MKITREVSWYRSRRKATESCRRPTATIDRRQLRSGAAGRLRRVTGEGASSDPMNETSGAAGSCAQLGF
ncbi:hypothetical protein E3N88_25608 [Mikania micrantha]|uniref:Uncharacterized protein n=1 Tax=Mikania micrantha TaxID=192012 RepID=A0A5N6N6U1_9ASTR|nr:hypothetical protein E3N88_25608 [Mikania micrantha]